MPATGPAHSTFEIERNYPKPPARVFAAFADPAKKRRWFAEGDAHDLEAFEMDFRVGGVERHRYRFRQGTPIAGAVIVNTCSFLVIRPDQLVVMTQTMDIDDHRMSASLVTFEMNAIAEGTSLLCTHQAVFFERSDGPEMRKQGWVSLFDSLGKELER